MFRRFDDITPEFLLENGIKYLLIDIDNTLAPYEVSLPDERTEKWFDELKKNNIKALLVSNNNRERVELFNSKLGLLAFPDSHKPSKRRLLKISRAIDADISATAAIGDQIFTDVYGAKLIGARAIMVPPINDKRTLFFRAKRLLEKPILKKFKKLHDTPWLDLKTW